jgi:hypothetical protein
MSDNPGPPSMLPGALPEAPYIECIRLRLREEVELREAMV